MIELPSTVERELGAEATTQKQTTQVSALTVLLALAVVLLALPYVGEWYYGKKIYYITDHGPGMAEPGKVPEGMALSFAKRWIETRHTYTPETYKAQIANIMMWLHPKARLALQKQSDEEYRDVLKRQQSSQASIAQDGLKMVPSPAPFLTVELVGIRSVFIGGQERQENMRTTMTLMPYFVVGYEGRLVVMREATTFGDDKR
jgi:hypothetical protein